MNCQICQRKTPQDYLEKHHLIPKEKHGAGMGTIFVCCSCGDQIHNLFSNKQLAKEYNTIEKILSNENINKWIRWIRNKPDDFRVCMRRKK
jgi:hypothetical protein